MCPFRFFGAFLTNLPISKKSKDETTLQWTLVVLLRTLVLHVPLLLLNRHQSLVTFQYIANVKLTLKIKLSQRHLLNPQSVCTNVIFPDWVPSCHFELLSPANKLRFNKAIQWHFNTIHVHYRPQLSTTFTNGCIFILKRIVSWSDGQKLNSDRFKFEV